MKNFVTTLCIGVGAGFVLGILTAPRSGAVTRSALQDKTEDGRRFIQQRRAEIERWAARSKRDGARMVTGQGAAIKAAVTAGKRAYVRAAG